jgi:hypothetical protein
VRNAWPYSTKEGCFAKISIIGILSKKAKAIAIGLIDCPNRFGKIESLFVANVTTLSNLIGSGLGHTIFYFKFVF